MAKNVQFEISIQENFSEGISRILNELHIESARLILAGSRQHISVHELRKNIKKIRGILRLLRYEIGGKKYRKLNRKYRKLAQDIAVLRDDTSQIELLSGMLPKVKSVIVRRSINRAIRRIESKRKAAFNDFYGNNQHQYISRQFNSQNIKNQDLSISGNPDLFILKGLYKIHANALKALRATFSVNNAEIYHNLRKQVKYLMYNLRILSPTNPIFFKAYLYKLNQLSTLLGKLHDLDLFNEHIHQKTIIQFKPDEKKEMLKIIYRNRYYLKKRIGLIGAQVFAENSKDFLDKGLWGIYAVQNHIS